MSDPHVVAVFGPTGSGKTDVAVHLARTLGTEVVNCDPAQCYRGFPILTNQPLAEHDEIARHRMVAVWALDTVATVADFARQSRAEVDALVNDRGVAVVCGGSGMYMRATLTAMQFGDVDGSTGSPAEHPLREQLESWYDEVGAEVAHARLRERDPVVAAQVHPNDRKRVVRGIEAVERGGSVATERGAVWQTPLRHPTTVTGLVVDRTAVRERVANRTVTMFANGVLDEIAAAVGPRAEHVDHISRTALQVHGVRDCIAVLNGEINTDVAIARLTTRTHQYVRRQDIWARRWPGMWRVPFDASTTSARDIATLVAAGRAGHVNDRG